ncbi:MAG TPA: LytTR family DNA-binding domain-containing protein [Bacteroidia bacterium]|jgi:two-component system LytT family response regulator|nr:LytTR family DNA-binding domain-containing protein [Bacteroidia bacterium]
MNCIIVDDNKMARTALKKLIEQVDFLNFKEECSSPVDAFNYLQENSTDLFFLDIEMPGMTGIELIKNLSIEKRPIIILITSKTEYAVEAFELNVADYIVKPVTMPRLLTALAKAKDLFDNKEKKIEPNQKDKEYIFVRSNAVLTKIKIIEITYIQALGDYVNIFTADKRYTVHITLKGMEDNLPVEKFYRLHRSYLIALDHIDKVEEGTAFIGKHPIPIGEQFKKELLKKLNLI